MNEEVVRQLVAVFSWRVDKKSERAVVASNERVLREVAKTMAALTAMTRKMHSTQMRFAAQTSATIMGMRALAKEMSGTHSSLYSTLTKSSRRFLQASRSIRSSTQSAVSNIRAQAQAGEIAMNRMDRAALRGSRHITTAMSRSSRMLNRLNGSLRTADRIDRRNGQIGGGGGGNGTFPRNAWMAMRGAHALDNLFDPIRTGTKMAYGAIAGGVGMAGRSWYQEASELEAVKAKLRIVMGSQAAASKAMEFIADFATTSPSTITEVADAYAKLVGFGIEPTIERMRALNDVAAATQAPLNNLVEGAKNVGIGLPRVLERMMASFGYQIFISRKNDPAGAFKQGDIMVQKGQEAPMSIGRDTMAVVKWLVDRGQTEFKGAAGTMMSSMPMVMSNVADAFTLFMNRVSESGALASFISAMVKLQQLFRNDTTISTGLAKVLTAVFDAFGHAVDWVSAHPGEVAQFFDDLVLAIQNLIEGLGTALSALNTFKPVIMWALRNLPELWAASFGVKFLSFIADLVFGVAMLKASMATSLIGTAYAAGGAGMAGNAAVMTGALGLSAALTAGAYGAIAATALVGVHDLYKAVTGDFENMWTGGLSDWIAGTGESGNRKRLAGGGLLEYDPSEMGGMDVDTWMRSRGMNPDGSYISPITNNGGTVNNFNFKYGDTNITANPGEDPEAFGKRVADIMQTENEKQIRDLLDQYNNTGS